MINIKDSKLYIWQHVVTIFTEIALLWKILFYNNISLFYHHVYFKNTSIIDVITKYLVFCCHFHTFNEFSCDRKYIIAFIHFSSFVSNDNKSKTISDVPNRHLCHFSRSWAQSSTINKPPGESLKHNRILLIPWHTHFSTLTYVLEKKARLESL